MSSPRRQTAPEGAVAAPLPAKVKASSKGRPNRELARLLAACGRSLDEHGAIGYLGKWEFGMLAALEPEPVNAWFTTQPLAAGATRRGEAQAVGLRVYCADLDADKTDPRRATRAITNALEIEPCAIVETGNGNWHAYWRSEPLDWAEGDEKRLLYAKRLTLGFGALAQIEGSDVIHDLARVLRVPGSINKSSKEGRNPDGDLVRLLWVNPQPEVVTFRELGAYLPDPRQVRSRKATKLPTDALWMGEPDEEMQAAIYWIGQVTHTAVRKLTMNIADSYLSGSPGGQWAVRKLAEMHSQYPPVRGSIHEALRVVSDKTAGAIQRAMDAVVSS